MHSRHPDMPLGEMNLGGSLLDDLQVLTNTKDILLRSYKTRFPLSKALDDCHQVLCVCLCVCLGGQCRPRVSSGAPAAGSFSVASHPGRGDAAHTPVALDGQTSQFRIFSQRTQLLGQVTTHWKHVSLFSACIHVRRSGQLMIPVLG